MWHSLQKLQQLGVAIVRDAALLSEVMMIRRDELAHGHDARWLTLQQVNDLSAELNELWVTNRTLAAVNPWLCRNLLLKLLEICIWITNAVQNAIKPQIQF